MANNGELAYTILRALRDEPKNTRQMQNALSATVAKAVCAARLERLAEQGLIAMKWGKWRLTRAGLQSLPTLHTLPPMQPYVPPIVYRRPGSDHSHIPSLMAGRRIVRATR